MKQSKLIKDKLMSRLWRKPSTNIAISINMWWANKAIPSEVPVEAVPDTTNESEKDDVWPMLKKDKMNKDLSNLDKAKSKQDVAPLRMWVKDLAKKVDWMETDAIIVKLNLLIKKYDLNDKTAENVATDIRKNQVNPITGVRDWLL